VAFAVNFDERAWTGGRNYLSTLFRAVREVAGDDIELVLVTGRSATTSLQKELPFLQVIRTPLMDRWTPAWVARKVENLLDRDGDAAFARLMRRSRIDVLSHSWGMSSSGVKTLGWLPDFQFMHFPDYWSPRGLLTVRRMYGAACRSCDALVVSSRDALRDLESFAPWCGVPKHVLHFVSAPVRFGSIADKASLCSKYGLPSAYLHLPNQFWAHKNHRLVIDALALLNQQGASVTVACTGHTEDFRDPAFFENLMNHCRAAGVAANFKVLGLVPYADVQGLMAHARAVINPSRFEGWSTSVEEAKTLGKRLLLSDIAVHREQSPVDAGYFHVDDAQALASLMQESFEVEPTTMDVDALAERYDKGLRVFGTEYVQLLRAL